VGNAWTGGHYSLYRALLGSFLIVHFAMLLPYGAEVFAAGGVLSSASLSPYIGILPNPLAWFDSPVTVTVLLALGMVSGAALALGWFDRCAALAAALILGWLFQRNPLIANPSLPLLSWLLLLHVFVPTRPYGSLAALRAGGADPAWRMPRHLYVIAWIVLAVSYSHSGYTKLFSPSWIEGETIRLVLENPLARDHLLRDLVLALPPIFLKLLTWGVLWAEVLFAPLALIRRLRPGLWTLMLLAQLGFLCFLNFADLTFPMLLAHLLTFDPRWLKSRAPAARSLLLFDGDCAFCHATVRLAVAEDHQQLLSFVPLASPLGRTIMNGLPRKWHGDTIVLLDSQGHAVKSRAVAGVLEQLGGLWFCVGRLVRAIPRPIADAGYDFIGRIRYRLGGRRTDQCPVLPAGRMASESNCRAPGEATPQ
jgi:predicted DCC family thiol-disulfide oxidoreductase YuxK